jgi:hypothetical protein
MDLQVARMKNFVGGELVEAWRGEWEPVIEPATGEALAEAPRCTEEDVDRAVEAASGAFDAWFDTTPQDRSEMLHRLADALQEHAEELAGLESRDVGKPITRSFSPPALRSGGTSSHPDHDVLDLRIVLQRHKAPLSPDPALLTAAEGRSRAAREVPVYHDVARLDVPREPHRRAPRSCCGLQGTASALTRPTTFARRSCLFFRFPAPLGA